MRSRLPAMLLPASALLLASGALMPWWWPATTPPGAQGPHTTGAASAAPLVAKPLAAAERVDATQGAANSEAPPIPADVVQVEVRVVDAATKTPIAGADVWWKDASCDERVQALPAADRRPFYEDEERVFREFGWHARSDERGAVRVSADKHGTSVIARAEGRWGSAGVEPGNDLRGVELLLERDFEITVRVVDGAGQPVPEVPVNLDHSFGMRTDGKGLVVFQHLQYFAAVDNDGALVSRDEGAYLAIPGLQRQRTTFPLLSPPKEPLLFVVPITGELHVHVLHPGRAVESVAAEFWIPAAEDEEDEIRWSRCADADGVVRFLYVPLAQTYELQASIGDFTLQRTIDGPKSHGQVVHAMFDLPADAIALTGRILNAEGRPVASTDLWVEMSPGSGSHFLTTDEQGRFLWHPHGSNDRPASRALEKLSVEWRRGPFDTLQGSVACRRLQAGINDLGDIRLDHAPLVVAGRFTFDRPAHRDDVEFRIEHWHAGDGAAEPGYWWAVENLDADHDRDGQFVVRGDPPPGRLRVNCGAHAEPVEFERGTTDLVIPFVRGHAAIVRLRVGNDVPFGDWFELTLTRDGEPASARVFPVRDGTADCRPLVAGTYLVDVRLAGLPDVLGSERIVLPGPEGEFEPVIQVDLRKRVELLTLRFTANGESVGAPAVFVDQALDAGLREGILSHRDEWVLPIPPRAVDLTIVDDHYEPVFVRGARGSVDVRLTPRPTVQLTVRGVSQLGPNQEVELHIAAPKDTYVKPKIAVRELGRFDSGWVPLADLLGIGDQGAAIAADGTADVVAAREDRVFTAMFRGRRTAAVLQSFSPKIIPAGTAPLTITFDPAEIRAAMEADEQAHKEK